MNFFEEVSSLIRAGGSLEDLGKGLGRVLDHGRLSGFVFYGKPERCLVTVPYRSEDFTAQLRDRFESSDWRGRPREAFLEAFGELEIPTGEIGEGIRWSFLGSEEEPLGAFACVRDPSAPPPPDTERKVTDFFFRLAAELAQQSVRARSREHDAQERDYLLEVMNQVGRLMLERPDRERLLPSLLKIALDAARTEVGSITLASEGRFATEVEWGLPGELLEGIRFLPEEKGILERIQETLEPVIVDDFSGPTIRMPDGFPVRISTLIAVPLLAGDRLIGVLSIATGEDGREMLPSAVTSLTTIASLIATALENLRLREIFAARAEEAHQGLAQEQKLLRQVLANLGEGVLVSDSAGRIVIANHAAEEMLGLGGGVNRRFPERNVVTLRPFFTWLRERWAANVVEEEAEYSLAVHPPAVLSVRIFPLKGSSDRFSRMTVIHDGARERAGAAVSSWPGRIASEIETPLAAARAALALKETGEPRDFADTVAARGLSRIAAVAEDLRALALLDGGPPPIERSEFSLDEAVEEALREHREELEERGIAYRGPDPFAGGSICAARPLLVRALRRLFAAVVRFTAEEGWIRVDIARGLGTAEIGMTFLESQASQGFEAIFSGHAEAPSGAEGSEVLRFPGGLGLQAARAVVELHGGRLRARSEKDIEGSVILQLPTGGTAPGNEAEQSEEANDLESQFLEARS